ncbi:hypothetical protein TorRG33x02_151780 [Trema orientale]|uniref:Uncharacterized protein n=1 Tax=Trema orientale TaxID=63057 RepID=A0A2P5ETS7_TREOI|nr:hypothetical protein TorRG33x02_151780 [Trema orientale]
MAPRKAALAMILIGVMVIFASMDVGEAMRYRIMEPCFGTCVKECMGVPNESMLGFCQNQCKPLCSEIECIFCWSSLDMV